MPTIKPNSDTKAPAKPSAARASQPTKSPAKTRAKTVPVPAPVEVKAQAPAAAPKPALVPKAAASKAKTMKAAEQRAYVARQASVMLKFVSDPTRLQVILYLSDAEHHVGALCDQLGQSQPAVSHHLALLRHGGIISPRRSGKNNFYSLSGTGVELAKVVKSLLQIA